MKRAVGSAQRMAKDNKGKSGLDQDLIRELAGLLDETGLSEIEVEREGTRVRVARRVTMEAAVGATPVVALQPAPGGAPAGDPGQKDAFDPSKHPGCVPSPMVGTVYLPARARGRRPLCGWANRSRKARRCSSSRR